MWPLGNSGMHEIFRKALPVVVPEEYPECMCVCGCLYCYNL